MCSASGDAAYEGPEMAIEHESSEHGHFTWRFMKEVFRTTKTTGAVGPSSMALAEEVTCRAQLQ
ncbi:MAG TPA: hypothetical protein PKL84_19225, partial [Candidatus Hydrogenedentes bacterium]|nr:hypothetical protein [Candidatus Hydrogenedentota bacterium]